MMSQVMPRETHLEAVEVGVEAVSAGDVALQSHDELPVNLRSDVHRVGNLKGFPRMPWERLQDLIISIMTGAHDL